MPLLGPAAMLLSFDIIAEAIAEHDDWHTHEHLPERLSIPGFLRGSRWTAVRGEPRYLVLYEVAGVDTLISPAYLERLNHPSPWTQRMMTHYRRMSRGLCSVAGTWGLGLGGAMHAVRFKPNTGTGESLHRWIDEVAPPLVERQGIGAVHLLKGAAVGEMTNEQRIRGEDSSVDWAVLVAGYDPDALLDAASTSLGAKHLRDRGASVVSEGLYALHYSLSRADVEAGR